jgi:hypothetical protein
MMKKSVFPDHDGNQQSKELAWKDVEVVHGESTVADRLEPPSALIVEDHGAVNSSEEQHFRVLHSPPTSTGDEKVSDLELGRTGVTEPQASHTTPAEPIDSNIISWDGLQDPSNPVNWSAGRKWINVIVVSTITFITQVWPFPQANANLSPLAVP